MTIREVYFKKVYFKQVLNCRTYIPNHKEWVQLFCEDPINDKKKIVDIDGVPTEIVDEYAYEMNQRDWQIEFDTEPTYDEEGIMITDSFINENFDDLFNDVI